MSCGRSLVASAVDRAFRHHQALRDESAAAGDEVRIETSEYGGQCGEGWVARNH